MHLKRRNSWPPDVSALDALNDYMWQRHLADVTDRSRISSDQKRLFFTVTP